MSESHCIPAAAYLRMSNLIQEDSIERQRAQITAYALKQGYVVVREYVDEGISGTEEAKRKAFRQLIEDARRGLFRAILVDEDDRFCRFDSIDYGYYVKPLRDQGITLVTVAKGPVDWNSFAGRITSAVQVEGKNQEQESIARRTLTGMLNHAAKGQPLGGRVVYGYRIRYREGVDRKGRHKLFPVCYEPDPKTAPVVQLIFRLALAGSTLGEIAAELYRRGVVSPSGKPLWSRNVLWRLLKKRKYVGDFIWGELATGKRMRLHNGTVRPRQPGERPCRRNDPESCTLKRDAHEAIIDRDTFAQVQALLAGNRGRTTPHVGGGGFVLSKLLVCGHCGSHLRGLTRKDGARVYVCGGNLDYGKAYCAYHTVHEQTLLQLLIGKLQEEWLAPAHLQALRDEVARQEQEVRSDNHLQRLRQERDRLEREVTAATGRLFQIDADNLREANAYLRDLKARRDQAVAALDAALTAHPVRDVEEAIAATEKALWQLREALQEEDRPLLRQVLRETFSKIVLHFEHYQRQTQHRSRLLRGEAYVRPQEQYADLFPTGAR